jgi:hypothetical protein
MAARPSRSFFVLDRTTIPVKIKARTNMDNKGCSGVLANIVQGRTGVRNFPQPRSCQTAMNQIVRPGCRTIAQETARYGPFTVHRGDMLPQKFRNQA